MDALKLINPEFDLEFAGKAYKVRKANLERVILFQERMVQLADAKDPSVDIKGVAYCIYLTIHSIDETITEEWVMQNTPGDIDPYDMFEQLGFMNRQKVELMKALMMRIRNAPVAKTPEPTGGLSSAS